MKVTLKQIADDLGISVTTVSRALNDQGKIARATRDAVVAKAKELGYTGAALPEAHQTDTMVGVVFSKRLEFLPSDPFYGIVMLGVESECQQHHTQVVFHVLEHGRKHRLWKRFDQGKLHGLILVGGDIPGAFVEETVRRGIPVVVVDHQVDSVDVDTVMTDNAGGIRKAMGHLVSLGHRRIGFVGGPLRHRSLSQRYGAYCQAMLDLGLPRKESWSLIHNDPGPTFDKGYQAIHGLHAQGLEPTALLCDNDNTAVGMLKACYELKIDVPEQLSIVGFDNIAMAEHVVPGITSVHINKEAMGQWAAKRIHERMQGGGTPVTVSIGTELIVRGSTAVARDHQSEQWDASS